MIKAIFQADEGLYRSLDVSGHAEYGAYGKDLICASVSSIMFGFMNALDALEENVQISQSENRITIVDQSGSEIVQHYFELVITQLKTIEASYGDFIRVERK
ncbi:MAG: ribosomal-processing cysteine protease Prp [Erysipelotrichaceae bacterium]|nr:ribosomal-processing cysteine protease Prp [Erysipelotrichaceae bacterium]MBR4610349.1 ribosomal-processing cysteine protease Prp [Erysipelotrichaceae bacterium]MBR6725125.1 ribosomal-processing cysteine protease Prp [Erysipelotrichaceae bacterium]